MDADSLIVSINSLLPQESIVIRETIIRYLDTHPNSRALDIARAVISPNSKRSDVNPTLYSMHKEGLLLFSSETPPRWNIKR